MKYCSILHGHVCVMSYQVTSKSAHWFLERRFLKCLYHIHTWAWQPSWSCDQHHFTYTSKLTYKIWLKMAQRCLRFSYVTNLGQRSGNDFDFQYSLTFINCIICLHLPIFRPLATIVSEISTVFTFSYRKA